MAVEAREGGVASGSCTGETVSPASAWLGLAEGDDGEVVEVLLVAEEANSRWVGEDGDAEGSEALGAGPRWWDALECTEEEEEGNPDSDGLGASNSSCEAVEGVKDGGGGGGGGEEEEEGESMLPNGEGPPGV